ncbi:peroxisomal and mitochondrial division factor 2 [Cornus florida]|uniref:peroxisomal and mitochondrial division factor 2 n=1 Tax=Cornus florida TaxID=4283 RepID=UPI00289D60F1|nr:peroxisomal and mitochondrial division factor 2 [Cornus florida]XP_059664924.1 peroxisomal and mitochondrial division factor 2 [Cornus florida]
MADKAIVNGVATDAAVDRTVVISGKEDRDDVFEDFGENDAKNSDSTQRIAGLEQEKVQLGEENKAMRERVVKLSEEIKGLESEKEEMKREIDQSVADRRALESIAARAAELETEVSRLQHDLISSMTEGEEAKLEVSELKRAVEELRRSDSENGLKVEVLEKERNLLLERVGKEAENESQIRDLEKKIETLEARESTQNVERIKIEEEARGMIDERESEIRQLKKWVEELDSKGLKSGLEIERLKKEKEELQIMKNELEALLKKSDRKTKEMESKIEKLEKELEAAEQMMISGLKAKSAEGVNGKAVVMDEVVIEEGQKGSMGLLKQQWPMLAASTGAIAAVAVVCYLRYGRQR